MEYLLGIIVILSLSAVVIWSILHSSKEENAKLDKEFVDRIRKSALERKPSICIEVDGCKHNYYMKKLHIYHILIILHLLVSCYRLR